MSDPKRLLDGLGGGELRDLLEAGKNELPKDAQMLALAAKIGVAGALGAAGAGAAGAGGGASAGAGAGAAKAGAGAVAAVKGATAIKIGVAIAVVSAAGAGTVAVTSSQRSNAVESKPSGIVAAPSVTAASTSTGTASESLPARPDPFASASAEPSAKPAPIKSAAPNPAEEVKLLERAQDALRSGRHADALSLCNEHAKSYPNGMLAQEREVIAVEALVKTGRTVEAKARAEKFKARFPGSSHARRIDALIGR